MVRPFFVLKYLSVSLGYGKHVNRTALPPRRPGKDVEMSLEQKYRRWMKVLVVMFVSGGLVPSVRLLLTGDPALLRIDAGLLVGIFLGVIPAVLLGRTRDFLIGAVLLVLAVMLSTVWLPNGPAGWVEIGALCLTLAVGLFSAFSFYDLFRSEAPADSQAGSGSRG
jgi:hypothetical protein